MSCNRYLSRASYLATAVQRRDLSVVTGDNSFRSSCDRIFLCRRSFHAAAPSVRHGPSSAPQSIGCLKNQRCNRYWTDVNRLTASSGPLYAAFPHSVGATPRLRDVRVSSRARFSTTATADSCSFSRCEPQNRAPLLSTRLTGFQCSAGGFSRASGQLLSTTAPNEEAVGSIPRLQSDDEDQRRRESSYRAMKYTLATLGLLGLFSCGWTIAVFGAPPVGPDGEIIEDEFTASPVITQYMKRAWREVQNYNQMIKEPSRDLLLPEPLKFPYQQPPYTLVLEMNGVLVHPDWTYRTGWRFKKRPGVTFFLEQVGPPLFEVVIYTNEQGMTAHPILEALDPQGYIMYRLYKDSTRYSNNAHIKDLNCLNRDLSKVIIVDWDEKAVQLNPRNQLKVSRWTGADNDTSLVDLAMLLKAIATSGVEDVREVMDHYRQFDDPLRAFRENQRLLMEQEEAAREQKSRESKKSSLLRNSTGGLFSTKAL